MTLRQWQKRAYIAHETEKPVIKIETEEDAEEYIQKELTLLEGDINKCDISMLKRVDITRSSMLYYLNEGMINQPAYFEYNNQLNKIIRDAMRKCYCMES